MSEEELINKIKTGIYKNFTDYDETINKLLDLYKKEKEKYERLKAKINIMSQCSSDILLDLSLMELLEFIESEETNECR